MKDYFKYIGIGIAFLSVMGFYFWQMNEKDKRINSLSKEMIANAVIVEELREENRVIKSKLVDNQSTSKLLQNEVDSLGRLNEIIKKRKEKVIETIYQRIEIPSKADTTIVRDTIINNIQNHQATFYYPSKGNKWLTTDVNFMGGVGVAQYHFDVLELNLVVTETENGLYRAYAEGLDFLEFTDIRVKTLPLKPQFPKKPYQIYLGGGLGYIEGFKFYTSTSVKYKEHMMDLNLFGFSGITIGYKRPI